MNIIKNLKKWYKNMTKEKCQNCNYILEQEINDEIDYGNIKILTTLEKYEKQTKSNSDD